MAKTATAPAPANAPATTPPPAKKGGLGYLVMPLVIALVAIGSGAAVPTLLGKSEKKKSAQEVKLSSAPKSAMVPLGENVVVNLAEPRLTRYLRVKLTLVTDELQEKTLTDLLQKKRAFLKSWLIGHLSNQSLEEVTGRAGQNRLRREIRDKFNALLYDDESEGVNEVLFEEFVVQ